VEVPNLTHASQDLDDIKVSEVPQPQAKNGEVNIQIVAAGVNFVDLLYVRLASALCQLWSFGPSFVPVS